MKFLAALLLVVATVHANSLHFYAWAPGKETVFKFESQTLSGIPEIREQRYAGLRLKSIVRIQSFPDYTLRIKLENPVFTTYNGDITLTEAGRIIGDGGPESGKNSQMPEALKHYLEIPILVHLKKGIVETFYVPKEEPVSVTNIKKSLLAQLTLDVSATQRSQIESNHIQLPLNKEGQVDEHLSYFTTAEESIFGQCQTSYTVHRLPEWRIKELEDIWTMEQLKLEHGIEYVKSQSEILQPLPGKKMCEGKKYFKIIKTRDLENCKLMPVFQKWSGLEGICDVTKTSTCESVFSDMSTTTYYVCGELSEFHIRKLDSINSIRGNPLIWSTEEKEQTNSKIYLELLHVKPITEHIPLPPNKKEVKSIVYSYPLQDTLPLDPKIVKETLELLGTRPVLPQPKLMEPPTQLIPIELPKEQIVAQLTEKIQKLATDIFKSPESCSTKEDIAGSLTSIVRFMRVLTLNQLIELESKLVSGPVRYMRQPTIEFYGTVNPLEKVFYDALAMVGTNPSTVLIIKKIKEQSLPPVVLQKLVKFGIRNVRYPTEEIMEKLVDLAKSPQLTSPKLKVLVLPVVLNELSTLFYRAYIQPSTVVNNFPVRIYGVFGTKESPVLVEKYIPFLIELLERHPSEQMRLITVTALGKVGHLKALKPILKVIEGKISAEQSLEPMLKSVAVYSLKRLTKMNPTIMKPILLALIENPVEMPEVRIAAVSILPWTKPTVADLQKLAIMTWFETSKQVSSFITSTLKSLLYTTVPELKIIGLRAKPVLHYLKPEYYGIQYSANLHFSSFVEYLVTGVSQKLSTVMPKNGIFPLRVSMKSEYIKPLSSVVAKGFSFTVYTEGMEKLLEEYLHIFGKSTQTSAPVKQYLSKIVEELSLKTQQLKVPKMFLETSMMGIESYMYLDYETVLETLKVNAKEIENRNKYDIDYVSVSQLIDVSNFYITETGFPMVKEVTMPLVYSAKVNLELQKKEGIMIPQIKAKFIPVVNVKVQSILGVVSPFSKELLGVGVDMSLHSSLPLETDLLVSPGEVEVVLKTPTELEHPAREFETVHVLVLPFVFKTDFHSVKPISKSTHLKKIVTGKPLKPVVIPIKDYLGIKAEIHFESDAQFTDLYSYIKKLRQLTPLNLPGIALVPSSVKLSSTKLKYYPAQSQTKALHFKIKLSTNYNGMEQHPLEFLSSGPMNVEHLRSRGFESITEKIENTNEAALLEMSATSRGHYGEKSIDSAILLARNPEEIEGMKKYVTVVAANLVSPSGPVYIVKYESLIKVPEVKNRFDVEKLLSEPLELKYVDKILFGVPNQLREIKTEAKLIKTPKLIQEIKQSPEYKKCMTLKQELRELSPVCQIVRTLASSLDKIELDIHVPTVWKKYPPLMLIVNFIKNQLMFNIQPVKTPVEVPVSEIGEIETYKYEIIADRTSELAQVKALMPNGELYKLVNIRLLGYPKYLFPLPLLNRLPSTLIKKVTGYQLPPTCTIEPKTITTFDNKTFNYEINDCEHVVLADRTKKFPVAVLVRSMGAEKKIVKILSGIVKAELIPESPTEMKIIVNEKPIHLEPGKTLKLKRESNSVYLELRRYLDGVYMIHTPEQSLTVLTNGVYVEVVSPIILRGRGAGLCGDLNGEKIVDIKTPGKCVVTKPQIAAVSYILNKRRSSQEFPKCSGIPSQYLPEYEKELHECVKEKYLPTPVLSIYKQRLSLIKPNVAVHLVDKQRRNICFSKEMVRICSPKGLPLERLSPMKPYYGVPKKLVPKTVEYVCIPRLSNKALSLEKRALSGEPLGIELQELPVIFRKVEFVPITCGEPSTSYLQEEEKYLRPEYPHSEYPRPEYSNLEYPRPEYARSAYPQPEYPVSEYPLPEYPVSEYPLQKVEEEYLRPEYSRPEYPRQEEEEYLRPEYLPEEDVYPRYTTRRPYELEEEEPKYW